MSTRLPLPAAGSLRVTNIPAPAKINLFLHIVGRRPDGYHLLQSVFALVDWCDELDISVRPDGVVRRQDPHATGLPPDDLCVRAARQLQQRTGCPLGADITLRKNLPIEAGLGGGSSDAASTLMALNRLWGLDLHRDELLDIGTSLGADVPFFIGGRNAWVEGIGEQLQAIDLRPSPLTIVKPPQGVSTIEIFRSPNLKRDTKPATMADFAGSHGEQSPYTFGRNDLQAIAAQHNAGIQTCIDWLQSKQINARMTGSGSAVFSVHLDPIDVSDAPAEWLVKQTCILDVHPLIDWLIG